ncbi:assimilatory sulfite reductase (NADPH) flavoprotein subunit [Aliiglaciecola sp. CAU 1673]|uniref:assimilatory sulfite reductase (NADPH) flavoprotein subunit n=1 Tax=Aliiglaciecola sp. CAU 1673 TaxID=3032595 RepID=UPI0023DC5F9A|nr:assimilatory sulfite reductase (NADPH) flavoprotein subunit [Aliiglaciecola sp. CAU 1673]MDF2180328.1 assimilatory sulfite reductase (NADPH) flavoprotein subunit [Aliiglaciecola sp. CAU 1673]
MSSSTPQTGWPVSMLSDAQWQEISKAVAPLNAAQLTWVSGYLAGLAQSQSGQLQPSMAAVPQSNAVLTILYGSQTGNARGVAEQYKAFAESAGVPVQLFNMADYKIKKLKDETHLVIVVSTHGEGEAPDDAVELHEFLASKKASSLSQLNYAVLGLGDSSYEFFCQTAKDFDQRLAALGAKRIAERLDCDVDYAGDVDAWSEKVTPLFKAELSQQGHEAQVVALPGIQVASVTKYDRKNPFEAQMLLSQKITGRDSVKDIRHIEISLEGSGLTYRPGDALGVWFKNAPTLVERLLSALSLDADSQVQIADESLSLAKALTEKLELTQSYPSFVKAYAEQTQNSQLLQLVEDKTALREYLATRQIIDIVNEYPKPVEAQQLVSMLRPLTPRLYSIASSQEEVEDEVHLTVALVEYDAFGFSHQGGASAYLANGLQEGESLSVFVESNDNFKLPQDPNTPVIMVGPGTGIAPFRAFMQQREAEDAAGKNWLFFGNPSFTQDFLYQVEWQRWVKEGLLTNISLAFSRDQAHKIYVQHRLAEQGEEVFEWLQQGAHFYVCGDANHMAKDVHDALLKLVAEHGKMDSAQAEEYVAALRKAKRYQRDVY